MEYRVQEWNKEWTSVFWTTYLEEALAVSTALFSLGKEVRVLDPDWQEVR